MSATLKLTTTGMGYVEDRRGVIDLQPNSLLPALIAPDVGLFLNEKSLQQQVGSCANFYYTKFDTTTQPNRLLPNPMAPDFSLFLDECYFKAYNNR